MKKFIKFIYAIAAIAILSSCSENFIDIPAKGKLSIEAFVPEQAVSGCYAVFYGNDKAWGIWGVVTADIMGNVVSDDAWKGGANSSDGAALGEMELFQAKPNNGDINNVWGNYYRYIYYFNTALQGLENSSGLSNETRNRYMGEVKFLRAYTYMRLIMAFGNKSADLGVILIDKSIKQDEIGKLPRSKYQASWDLVISDFKFAEENLPLKSKYSLNNLGKATKGAAQALLARVYMLTGDWTDCELYAKKVIDSGEYQLEPQFSNVITNKNENGKESIFELAYSFDGYGGWDYSHSGFWVSAQQPRGPWGGWGLAGLTTDLLNEFKQNPGDPRIVWTFLFQGDEDISAGKVTAMDFTTWLCPDKMHNRKVWNPIALISPDGFIDFNRRVIRYADVILMYAEAANENGKSSEAMAALNQIRKRARESGYVDPYRNIKGYDFPTAMNVEDRVPDVTASTKGNIRNAIWHERRVEFAGEDFRFYDIVRQGRAGSLLRAFATKYNTGKGAGFIDGVNECFPIPSSDISASGGTLVQNPGY